MSKSMLTIIITDNCTDENPKLNINFINSITKDCTPDDLQLDFILNLPIEKFHLHEIDYLFIHKDSSFNVPNNYLFINSHPWFNEIESYFIYQNNLNTVLQEYQYLNCLQRILNEGEEVNDRTGIGTLSVFDMNMLFDIKVLNPNDDPLNHQYELPIFTTKNLFFRGIIVELLWFLNGHTNTKLLAEQNVHIWDGNTSRQALDGLGLDYEEGELGPGYGHQWINWGGDWRTGEGGINQIETIIHTLKTDPRSRRMVLNAWNVGDLSKMALPPCHMMYIFKVTNDNVLNCKVILRANDMFLGNPFNVVSASVLTILLARAVNMIPGKVALSICDAHIYKNHIEQVKLQLTRTPKAVPYMTIDKNINCYNDIKNLDFSDFKLSKYKSWPRIAAEMAV